MKKTLFMLLVAVMPLIATAQEEEVKVKVKEKEQAPSWSGFVTNRFWDNWFISISAGGQVYFGEFDSKEDFGRRITPTFDFSMDCSHFGSPCTSRRIYIERIDE